MLDICRCNNTHNKSLVGDNHNQNLGLKDELETLIDMVTINEVLVSPLVRCIKHARVSFCWLLCYLADVVSLVWYTFIFIVLPAIVRECRLGRH